MLPANVAGTYIQRMSCFTEYDDTDPSPRDIVVVYSTEILINILTALVCFRFLQLFGFSVGQAVAGVLALLFATTHLHYSQNMMENNYILLLTLAGFTFQYEWLKTGSWRALSVGSAALGLNLLTRLTAGLDLMAVGLFLLLVMWFERTPNFFPCVRTYLKTATPIYGFFLLLDRVYQFYRFGSLFNTYVSITAREARMLNPSLPPNYPWETPFHVGFLGPLISPEKSIFLFDPLVLLAILLSVLLWKRFSPAVKAYIVSAFLLLLAYICFYARYTVWSGDFAWGDRYVSTAAQLVAFVSVPLLLRQRKTVGKYVFAGGVGVIAVSAIIQVASLLFWLPLEIYQMETLGHPTVVIFLRMKNIAAFALGKMDQWGLNNHAMTEDPWDYVHLTTWNFLPFVLRRVAVAPRWVVNLTFALWTAALAAFAAALYRLRRVLRDPAFGEQDAAN